MLNVTNKAAIHSIVRESPPLLMRAVFFIGMAEKCRVISNS
ncbi:hypothetical protein HMPREF3213_02899 [Heyndrickxia coagulans]|uniref:Uncharacterized protein n=1 Tax=Heyndrickxia coagulans TaxID=1398 RepID=A0A133KGJ4_HEYCO|nr:hypothetical protein HMPREF3213_02899 [Heyndrickxia coagulans]